MGPQNNILFSKYSANDHDRFSQTTIIGQKSPNDFGHWETLDKGDASASGASMSFVPGTSFDSGVRQELQDFRRGEIGVEGQTAKEMAKWQANIKRARSFTYSARVHGFAQEGNGVWWPGLIVPVYDWTYEIDRYLFLKKVSMTKDWGGGAKTELDFTVADAYQSQPEQKTSALRGTPEPLGMRPKGFFQLSSAEQLARSIKQ